MSITIDGSANTIVGSTGTASISGITNILSGATANFTDFPRAQIVVSTANTGVTDPGIHALIAEAKSDGTYNAHGLDGCAATNGAGAAAGISGSGRVTATGDTGNAMGAYCTADMTHAGGANYGVFASASNGATNYSFYGAAGTLYNAGGVNSTPIGNVTPSTGAFTTLSATKATAGDVATFTNAAASNKVAYIYTDDRYVCFSTVAGIGNDQGLLFDLTAATTYIQKVGGTVAAFSTTGLAVTGTIKTSGYTVGTLPAGVTGDRAYVTDATTPTYLGALTGGGAVVCPVFRNATAWISA